MPKQAFEIKPALFGALLVAAGAASQAQNPQMRPPQPGTATGISGDSAASMPLPGNGAGPAYDKVPPPAAGNDNASVPNMPDKGPRVKIKDKPARKKAQQPDASTEPSDPHQVNGRASGGPDNKASQPDPGTGRGTGLVR